MILSVVDCSVKMSPLKERITLNRREQKTLKGGHERGKIQIMGINRVSKRNLGFWLYIITY
jgi:hypothetical protein